MSLQNGSHTMIEKHIDSLSVWFFENLLKHQEILHFASTRIDGFSSFPYESLNLGFHVGDEPQNVLKNRQHLASALRIPLKNFTVAEQIHSGNVAIVTEAQKGSGADNPARKIRATDAMVTDVPNICLMIFIADCVPILFLDPIKMVIATAHAGWRGTVKFIAQSTVKTIQEVFGSEAENILVGIGPAIGPCCYEVGPEVIAQVENVFHTKKSYIDRESQDGKGYFDLWEANKTQLVKAGIPEKNIEVAKICTYCRSDLFFSARKEKGKTGRFGMGIMIRN